jgi:5,10-methylenetetrahydrofolate reductase
MSDTSGTTVAVAKNILPHVDAVKLRYETRNKLTFEIEVEEVYALRDSYTEGVVYLSLTDMKKIPKILEKVFQ